MSPEEKLAFIQQLLDDTAATLFDTHHNPDVYRDFYEAVRILLDSDGKQHQSIKELRSFRIKSVIVRDKIKAVDEYIRFIKRK
jgi:hypothetical protein